MKKRQISCLLASLTGLEPVGSSGLLPAGRRVALPTVCCAAGGMSASEWRCIAFSCKKKQRKAVFSTRELRSLPLPLRLIDESISVYLKEVYNILLTEIMETFFLIDSEMMGPLAGGSKYAVPLEKMLADVKLLAGGGVFAGAVQPVPLVVMWANLCRARDTTLSHLHNNTLMSMPGHLPQEVGRDRSAATAGIVVSLSNLEDPDSSKPPGYFQKIDCGSFYTIF